MRFGAVSWVLTLQFFLAEYVVERRWDLAYDRNTYYISDLGAVGCTTAGDGRAVCSPWHALMNTSFVLQGALIVVGAVLLQQLWPGWSGRVLTALLVLAGLGVAVVGFFPQDTVYAAHYTGAAFNFVAGNLALVLLAVVARSKPALRRAGLWTGLVGAVGLIALVLFVSRADVGLGIGALERVVAYPIPLALPVVGAAALLHCRRADRVSPVH